MRTPLKHLYIVLIFCALGSGCTPMRYSELTGKLRNNLYWPQGTGTMAETSYSVPVYRGWPEKPYEVMGSIRFVDQGKYWDDGVISMAASMAKGKKGNAIIIRQGSEFGVGGIAGWEGSSRTYAMNETTALVIRWLTDSEVAKQERDVREVLRAYHAAHPNVSENENCGEIVLRFLQQSGLDARSEETISQFTNIMNRLIADSPENLTGEWVYKANIVRSSLGAPQDEFPVLGTATIRIEGESAAIVSDTGKAEINFEGTITKGRLTGHIGVGEISVACEGAALPNKISLSFQSLTSGGTVRGNIVFQRIIVEPNSQPIPTHKANPQHT